MSIINLTQHPASREQIAAGVVDLIDDQLGALKSALTFEVLPSAEEIRDRAKFIAGLAAGDESSSTRPTHAMIGGAMWLMPPLAAALRARGVTPLFAFSVRETEEQTLPDGSVRKTAIFRHAGFVPAVD